MNESNKRTFIYCFFLLIQFFTVYINNIDEKELQPKAAEVDLEQVSTSVQEALDTASLATQKLSEINQEIVTYVEKLHSGKALTK